MCPVADTATLSSHRFTENDRNRIGQMFFAKALQVVIGCTYEPTMHKQFMRYISMAKDYHVPYIGFTTNGQLLKKWHIHEFIDCGLSEFTISIHGVTRKTYQRLMVNASYEKLHTFLKNLDRTKENRNVDYPHLRINYTINSENIDEMPMFFKYFGDYGIKTLQIRPMHGDCYPQGQLTDRDGKKYRNYLKYLANKCSDRDITLLAHVNDLNFRQVNYPAIIYPEVFYHINPDIVWRKDFDWRNETHDAYCKRIKYNKYLLSSVLSRKKALLERAGSFSGSGRYDIF
jgi:MoaA/NifB/PqqE/SkfB family radical SAM enzyme